MRRIDFDLVLAFIVASILSLSSPTIAQIFVANSGDDTIGEYSLSGAMINSSLITGLHTPIGIALSEPNLFVTDYGFGMIGEYTASGQVVNASLISGLTQPSSVAISGSDLFVQDWNYYGGYEQIEEFTTAGVEIKSNAFPLATDPQAIVASGSDLFVASANGTIGEYTASGDTVNASLITGLKGFIGLTVSGSELFITSQDPNDFYQIGEYEYQDKCLASRSAQCCLMYTELRFLAQISLPQIFTAAISENTPLREIR